VEGSPSAKEQSPAASHCLSHPWSSASKILWPIHKDLAGPFLTQLLTPYKPVFRPPVASCRQRLRGHFDDSSALQSQHTVAAARKPKIMSNDERGQTIVAM
jgi:hypothetical protein